MPECYMKFLVDVGLIICFFCLICLLILVGFG